MAALRMADGRINNFITNLNDIVYDMRAFIILIVNIIYLNTFDMRVLGRLYCCFIRSITTSSTISPVT